MRAASALLLLASTAGQQMVAPGGVTPYSGGGGGGGPRFGGYVRLSEPVLGFFVTGSSIDPMNGVFGPRLDSAAATSALPPSLASTVGHGAYPHSHSGWTLAHVQKPGGRDHEWVLFDANFRERFACPGDSLIPSSGRRWSHLHRVSRVPPSEAEAAAAKTGGTEGGGGGGGAAAGGGAVRVAAEDDEDELPWQVIGLRDAARLESLRKEAEAHRAATAAAAERRAARLMLSGAAAPPPPTGTAPHAGAEDEMPAAAAADASAAREALSADQAESAAELFERAARASGGWAAAAMQLRRAQSLRRLGAARFDAAEAALGTALRAYPNYSAALLERALLMMDAW
ncbi:hypothetical protein EMIHUDRAFT_457707, partial [Emiliania huxleyi CCMP1516]|uniref:Uncharacterized protein n=2 Tax=Emiliania huxleyi TaxID=2903 RepID=A0A0D3JMT3_EMIH1